MPMKDTTHGRLNSVGIYSLHTTFHAKIINVQLNKAVFILFNPDMTSPTFSTYS